MIIRILRWLRGYVYIMLSGDCPERMLNILGQRRLPFWDIKRLSGIRICMYAAHAKKLHALRRKTGISVKFISRRGLPFILRRYSTRKGFALGFVLFFALQIFASQYIWNINVEGNSSVSSEAIINYLAQKGITEGTPAKAVDCDNLRLKLAMDIKDISWASLSVEGSCLTVSVHERPAVDTSAAAPCNLVALRDGIVGDLRVLSGKTMVKKGDTVTKGQLLVSGVLEYSTGNTDFVAAKGEIFAFTTRDITLRQPMEYIQTRKTGKVSTRRALNFFGLKVPLYLGNLAPPFEKSTEYSCFKTDLAYLPIGLYTAHLYETEERLITLTPAQAEELARQKMDAFCQNITDFEIISFTDTVSFENGCAVVKRHIQARENIAQTEVLQIDDAKHE